MKDTGEERRNFARERIHIEVELSNEAKHIRGLMEYVSFGGAFISLSKPFPKDSIVQVAFSIPGESVSFQGSAKVVWVQKDRAMGIQFVSLPESERLKLERLLLA
jgi:Tfp pilus assembly protein PilZ